MEIVHSNGNSTFQWKKYIPTDGMYSREEIFSMDDPGFAKPKQQKGR